VNISAARTHKLLRAADADGSGEISLAEWLHAVDTQGGEGEFSECISRMNDYGLGFFHKPTDKPSNRYYFMLRPHSPFRASWDLMIAFLLLYVALLLPFTTSWGPDLSEASQDVFSALDTGVDITFLVDVFLNFRTGFVDATNQEVMDWKFVGIHYIRTWFLLDIISSLPLDRLDSQMGNAQMLKLGKIGKIARVFKVFRPATAQRITEFTDDMMSSFMQRCRRRSGVFFLMLVLCHWLACFIKFADPEALTGYQDVAGDYMREYLTAIYWSMTTLTTVGYGDIIPTCDWGRICCTVAMVLGGTFYGYVIGNISSIVANKDLNQAAYYDRLDGVNAWLDFHHFPRQIRKRVRNHFREFLAERAAISETQIFDDLSPPLRQDLGKFLIKEEVIQNPIFDGLSIATIVRMQKILHHVSWEEERYITVAGDSGTTMFLIISGKVHITAGADNRINGIAPPPPSTVSSSESSMTQTLGSGDSFGEEVLLGFSEQYEFTTWAETRVSMHMIEEEEFENCFKSMPDVIQIMKKNAQELFDHLL
jgi:CRP-like cAMP-binding protein